MTRVQPTSVRVAAVQALAHISVETIRSKAQPPSPIIDVVLELSAIAAGRATEEVGSSEQIDRFLTAKGYGAEQLHQVVPPKQLARAK